VSGATGSGATGSGTEVRVRPVTADRWDDLARLFGPNGAYSNCWCTFFRQTGAEFGAGCANRGSGNRTMLRTLVRDGSVPGLLAYRGGDPVGWVSVAPRTEFGRVLRSPITRLTPDERDDGTTWAVVCFYVPRGARSQGVGHALLNGAVDWARERGASRLEGYPADPGDARPPSSSMYVGTVSMFVAAGFTEVARRVAWRPVMELRLR
jgi:GNAT superfamily N-acetyltransferase